MTRTVAIIAGVLAGLLTTAGIVAALAPPPLPPLAQGIAAEDRGDLAAAQAIYAQVTREGGQGAPALEARRRLAAIHRGKGEISAAVALMKEVGAQTSASPADLLLLGDLQIAARAVPEAVSTWSRLATTDGPSLEGRLEAARRLVDVGHVDEARRALESLAGTEAKVAALCELAALDVLEGRYADAGDRLDAARLAESTAPDISAVEGELALAMGDLAEADRALGEALARVPGHRAANLARAQLLALRHEEAEAAAALTAVLRPGEAMPSLRLGAARHAVEAGAHPSAAALEAGGERCAELERLAPGHPLTFQCVAVLALARGEAGQAQRVLSGVKEMAPGDVEAALLWIDATERLGDDRGAAEAADAALARWPGSLAVRTRHARALGRTGRLDDAARALVALVSEYPSYWPALVALGDVQLAAENLRHAESAFREALKLAPRAFEARYGLARLYLAKDQPPQARAECEAVLAQRPQDAQALVMLAGIDALMDQEEDALKRVAQAREAGATPEDFQGVPGLDLLASNPEYARLVAGGQ